jgi:hypothetical protein
MEKVHGVVWRGIDAAEAQRPRARSVNRESILCDVDEVRLK